MIRALRKRRLTLGDAHALFQECETILRADYVALGKNLDAYRPFVGESENDRFPCCTAAGLILDMERRQRPVAVNAGSSLPRSRRRSSRSTKASSRSCSLR